MTTPNPDGYFAGGNGGCSLFPTLEWFMQVPGTPATGPGRRVADGSDTCKAETPAGCKGNCYNGLFWDPDEASPTFMDNAVIYGLNVAQGSYAMNVVGYIGSVRAYTTNGYDYVWVFK
jgi:hypothetical protein